MNAASARTEPFSSASSYSAYRMPSTCSISRASDMGWRVPSNSCASPLIMIFIRSCLPGGEHGDPVHRGEDLPPHLRRSRLGGTGEPARPDRLPEPALTVAEERMLKQAVIEAAQLTAPPGTGARPDGDAGVAGEPGRDADEQVAIKGRRVPVGQPAGQARADRLRHLPRG